MAAVKTPELFAALAAAGHEVKVAATGPALTFFDPEALPAAPAGSGPPSLTVRDQATLYLDPDEWPRGRLFRVGEPVLHIELRRWADLLLIAPLDANTLAKLALGLCDTLLTCVYRAWDPRRPLVLAPAMNTLMWEHPATVRHLGQLLEDHAGGEAPRGASAELACEAINGRCPRLRIVGPQVKRLACGDEGLGAMAPVPAIVQAVGELSNGADRSGIPGPDDP